MSPLNNVGKAIIFLGIVVSPSFSLDQSIL